MKRIICSTLVAAACLGVLSCDDNNIGPEATSSNSEYILLTDIAGLYSDKGSISKYIYPSNTQETNVLNIEDAPENDMFADAAADGEYLYLIRQRAGVLDKVSLSDNTLAERWQASPTIQHSEDVQYDKTIGLVNDKVAVAYRKVLPQGQYDDHIYAAYLKFFDKNTLSVTDSVFIDFDYDIADFKTINNKIFLSLTHPASFSDNLIAVVDAQTKTLITTIAAEHPTSQLIATADNQLLAITTRGIVKIDPVTYAATVIREMDLAYNFSSSSPTAALDKKNNILYYYSPAPQPSPTPFILAAINLNTLENWFLTAYEVTLTENTPIAYDNRQEVIVISTPQHNPDGTTGSKLLIFDKNGKILQEALFPGTIEKIVLRQGSDN